MASIRLRLYAHSLLIESARRDALLEWTEKLAIWHSEQREIEDVAQSIASQCRSQTEIQFSLFAFDEALKRLFKIPYRNRAVVFGWLQVRCEEIINQSRIASNVFVEEPEQVRLPSRSFVSDRSEPSAPLPPIKREPCEMSYDTAAEIVAAYSNFEKNFTGSPFSLVGSGYQAGEIKEAFKVVAAAYQQTKENYPESYKAANLDEEVRELLRLLKRLSEIPRPAQSAI